MISHKEYLALILENIIPLSKKEIIEKGESILESVGNDIISYSRAKEIVTAYENAIVEENYRNNLAREEGMEQGIEQGSREKQLEIAHKIVEKKLTVRDVERLVYVNEAIKTKKKTKKRTNKVYYA